MTDEARVAFAALESMAQPVFWLCGLVGNVVFSYTVTRYLFGRSEVISTLAAAIVAGWQLLPIVEHAESAKDLNTRLIQAGPIYLTIGVVLYIFR